MGILRGLSQSHGGQSRGVDVEVLRAGPGPEVMLDLLVGKAVPPTDNRIFLPAANLLDEIASQLNGESDPLVTVKCSHLLALIANALRTKR